MYGELVINDEGLVAASNTFGSLSTKVSDNLGLYKANGDTLKSTWMGVGSSAFVEAYETIDKLVNKTSQYMASKAQATLSANERFKEADRQAAQLMAPAGSGRGGV